ncbi:MAG: succinate dehydrogenase, cytochrome b556 subunit [Pseudomonadota bacterium]
MAHTPMAERPLSPHLQIYRWTMTMATSIIHRATGMAMMAGTVLLAFWLVSAAMGPEAYAFAQGLFGSPFGLFVLFGYTYVVFFHMLNGLRYMFWDLGHGFNPQFADMTGTVAVAAAGVLTLLTWSVGLYLRGGF